ncbi:hypothetical protein CGLAMM_07175 [Acetobacteraceae bacterium EV16G]|uniref:Uncharacterized protein n=1 Tax=Sorlinia euscelidii TaxID=3081148 RepID=A0ABU7U6W6_9PROT
MDINALLNQLQHALPESWAVYTPFIFLMLSGLCNVLAVGLKPPTLGSKHYLVRKFYYLIVTWGALNLGHASNRLQCERTGFMVKRDEADAAHRALTKAGIDVLTRDHDVKNKNNQE